MMEQLRRPAVWCIAGTCAAVAAALGFGAAQWMGTKPMPAAASVVATDAQPANDPVEIKIPAQYLAAAKITVEPVTNGTLEAQILTAGTITAPPNSAAIITARGSGAVSRVYRQLGDTVSAGETLAQIESQEASTIAADRRVTNAKAELARTSYARESSLFNQGVTSRQDMEAAQSALAVANSEAQRAAMVARVAHVSTDGRFIAVVSPIAGKITASMATLGGFAQPQTELFHVASAGPVQVEASLPAGDIGRVAVGDRATIMAASGVAIPAAVRTVTPTVSGSTRAATVVLSPEGSRGMVVGEGVQVRLHVKDGVGGLVVPEDAVQNIGGRDVLLVRTEEGFRIQPVLVGRRSRGLAQIISGVEAKAQIATRNAFLIKADMIKTGKEE